MKRMLTAAAAVAVLGSVCAGQVEAPWAAAGAGGVRVGGVGGAGGAGGHWHGDVWHPGEAGTCGKAEAARRMAAAGMLPDEDPEGYCAAVDSAHETDLLHCNLEVEIVPSGPLLSGRNTMTIRSLTPGLTEFMFRLRNNYTITSATINGTTPVVVTSPSATTRVAVLDRAYEAEEIFTLTIEYSGVPVSRGFGSIEFRTQGGQPLVFTLSEPYYAYTWWPCKDGDFGLGGDTIDKFTMDLAIVAPGTMRSVSNGLLQGVDDLSGGRKRYRWSSQLLIPTYLVAFSSTNYNQWQQTYTYPLAGGGVGTMPVEFSIYPSSDTPANRAAWEKCIQMLETFRPLYGLYPFAAEKYGIYQFAFSGGMEHQTYSGQGTFNEGVTAHEAAHQWWGDDVTCRTWHDIWLNEGFATYSEALWEQYKPGSSGEPALHAAMAARRPSAVSDSVYVYDAGNLNRIFSSTYSYRKGAWVVHMLRKVIGEQAFFDTLAAYRAAYSGSAATTDDFAAVVSSVAGRDMSFFFNQWIYEGGAAAYARGVQPVVINGQAYVRVHLRQTQSASYPTYAMPVDLQVTTAAGTSTVTVWNDARMQHYLLPLDGAFSDLVVDPLDWILTTAKANESYVSGPPKVIAAAPGPGAIVASGASPGEVSVVFSDLVTVAESDLVLEGPGGVVAGAFSYLPATHTAKLEFAGALPAGAYTLTVRDTVRSQGGNVALDGEIGESGLALPSGDGLPGGDSVIWFEVEGTNCYANCDGSTVQPVLNVADFACFLQRFAAGDPYANCDGSTVEPVLNVADFSCFLAAFAAGCW
jgi:aminopeptidase N